VGAQEVGVMAPVDLDLQAVCADLSIGHAARVLAQACEKRYAYELHNGGPYLAWFAAADRLYQRAAMEPA
jgi:hypothetical protein